MKKWRQSERRHTSIRVPKFDIRPLRFGHLRGRQHLDFRLVCMLFHATSPGLVRARAIDVAEIGFMACWRLKIAKDLLFKKAGVLDPEKEIDGQYKGSYDVQSISPPSVM